MAADTLDPYGVDQEALARRQRLAQLLIGQGMDMSPVVSPWQGLARVAQSIVGNMQMKEADQGARDLSARRQADRSAEMGQIMDAATSPDAQGGGRLTLAKMLARSQDPTFQQAGLALALKGPEAPIIKEAGDRLYVLDSRGNVLRTLGSPKMAALDPKDYTPESWAAFQQGGGNDTTALRRFDKPPEAVSTFEAALKSAGIDPASERGKQLYAQFATRQATHAPGTNVTVNTGKKFGETLATNVAEQVAQSADTARGAVETLATAKQINAALDSGKVMAGPGTSAVMFVQQAIGAPSSQEGIVQTRQVIQGLSQMTLNSRKSLKGQGQISDFEGKLLAKAASGDIDSLTVPEIKAIVATSVRLSNAVLQQHQSNVKRIAADPELKQLAPFFDVQLPNTAGPSVTGPTVDDLVKKYGN